MNREQVISKLKEGLINIEFQKVDGTLRPMVATLSEEFITPPQDPAKTTTATKKSDAALAVWDFDASGWRSFRWDLLKKVDGEDFVNAN